MGKVVSKIKQAAALFKIPQRKDETIEAIAEIGRRQRERQRLEAAMNDALAVVKQKFEEDAAPHNEAIRDLSKGVQAWCEANRAQLTQDGKVKYANLASGEIKWRMRPPKVVVRGAETVIELLKQLGLKMFLREKTEINKEAILAGAVFQDDKILAPTELRAVPGIKLEQAEDFVIIPFESQLEEVA